MRPDSGREPAAGRHRKHSGNHGDHAGKKDAGNRGAGRGRQDRTRTRGDHRISRTRSERGQGIHENHPRKTVCAGVCRSDGGGFFRPGAKLPHLR